MLGSAIGEQKGASEPFNEKLISESSGKLARLGGMRYASIVACLDRILQKCLIIFRFTPATSSKAPLLYEYM